MSYPSTMTLAGPDADAPLTKLDLTETKTRLDQLEATLGDAAHVEFARFATPHGELRVYLTSRLRRRARKARVWRSRGFVATLKNAAYGFSASTPRSRGGSDGVFLLDRTFKPANSMMRRVFDQFLDKSDPLLATLEDDFDASREDWVPVRLVSHHMRVLGVLLPSSDGAHLFLVDVDKE